MRGWHEIEADGWLTICRHRPPRWDVSLQGFVALQGSRRWRAHAIRRDLWRALQHMRGFSPVVAIARRNEGFEVAVGGAILGTAARDPLLEERIERMLVLRHRARLIGACEALRQGVPAGS